MQFQYFENCKPWKKRRFLKDNHSLGVVSFIRFPLSKNSPSEEFSNPAIKLRRIDFPQPDSPNMATNSPSKI
jgi:hypothetical protein